MEKKREKVVKIDGKKDVEDRGDTLRGEKTAKERDGERVRWC